VAPKPDVSEERTEQILDAALAVFAERGFDNARMQDIGDRAGISKATVYLYFKSKDALIRAIVKRLFNRELAALEVLEDEEDSARRRLTRFVEVLVEDVVRMRPLMPLLYEFYAMGLRKKAVRRILGDFFVHFIDVVAPVIQEGIDRGEFCAVDARQIAVALGSTMEGTLLLWAFAPEEVALEAQLKRGFELLLTGLCNDTSLEDA
jgi:AcrR family transcriptional regulator